MHSKVKRLVGVWMVVLLSVTSVDAAAGLPLIDAVRDRDIVAVRALLQQGADVNAPQADGATALHWAAHWDDLATADLLIRAGANVNAANDLGFTPLWLACSNGNAGMVEKLLAAGANPNAARSTGETAIMTCARPGSLGAVTALLAHGANVNVRESVHGQTALMWAVANRHPDVVRTLIAHGANIHTRSKVRRVVVNLGGSRGGAGSREKNAAEVEQGGSTPLLFAARSGDLESAKLLVAAGANVHDTAPDGNSVLVVAAHSGHGSVAAFLLDKNADANAAGAGYTALHAAVLRGDLRDRGPCCPAIWLKNPGSGLALVTALVAHGANPNVRFTKGTPVRRWSHDFVLHVAWLGATPFWLAARFLEVDMMRLLGANGADPRVPSNNGTTPLMVAAGLNHTRARGTVAFVRDRRDFSAHNNLPLEIAAIIPEEEERLALEAVTLAVELGADVNAVNQAGDTALHGAASLGMDTVVRFLADSGANLNVKNESGRTPLAMAPREAARQSTATLLRGLGANE